jgi:hypothetical protein
MSLHGLFLESLPWLGCEPWIFIFFIFFLTVFHRATQYLVSKQKFCELNQNYQLDFTAAKLRT